MPTTTNPCAQPCAQCPYHPNLANANIAQQLMLHIEQMATAERRQMLLLIDAILAASQRPPTTSAASTTKPKRAKKR